MNINKLELILQDYMDAYHLPGLSIGIVKENELIYENAIGVRNINTMDPLTPYSLFHMASVSKPFSATAIMQLVEKGEIDLNAPLTQYLPYFQIADQRYNQITIQHMLSHISGLPDVEDYHWEQPEYDDQALERFVKSITDRKLISNPGESFAYSNLAYEILGDVIAKVSGYSFEAYIKEYILKPLGMYKSTFLKAETDLTLTTTPHVRSESMEPITSTIYPYNRQHAPSSTLHSNVHEMAHWAITNLNLGIYNENRILTPQSYNKLWYPYVDINFAKVGLSWFISDYKGHRKISHSGGDVGFSSYFTMFPEDQAAIILMSNIEGAPLVGLSERIFDLLLGMEPDKVKKPISIIIGKMIFEKGIVEGINLYHQIVTDKKHHYNINEEELNNLGYKFIGSNRLVEALEILKLNAEVYPNSANAYDSLGEIYLLLGNKKLSLENYKKSIKLDPKNQNALNHLNKLLNE